MTASASPRRAVDSTSPPGAPRRAADCALAGREAHLRLMLEQLPALLWTADTVGRFTSVAGAGLAALELDAEESLGTLVSECFGDDPPHDRAGIAIQHALLGRASAYEGTHRGRTYQHHIQPLRADGAITGVAGIAVDVTERKHLEARLAHQAFHDPLTGLANRALFRDRVQHALARGSRGERIAVLFLDLDDFKAVNDSLGHAEGDELLRGVAERLRGATRDFDTVARLGGDEFALLLEGMASPGEAERIVERLQRALAAPLALAGREVSVRASIGLAHATGGKRPETADELLRNADVAMYRAKADGKGRFVVFEPAMHAAVMARLELEGELRRALADPVRAGLRLVYQPVVDLGTGRLAGFEALVRWDHPTRGVVPPAQFIPLAEETGLVVEIGRWAIHAACDQLAAWERTLPPWTPARRAPTLAVNISGRQLEDERLAAELGVALRRTRATPQRITLEITESAIMRNTAATLTRLDALKALGVRLAIDDFGTGYSSLAYLQRFPVDVIKIDKLFVDGVARAGAGVTAGHDAALVRTMIALSDTLGLATVAEGIEREEQRQVLAALGCRYGQGYLFARPLSASGATELVRALYDAPTAPPPPRLAALVVR